MTSAALRVETPEGVVFSFRLASPITRGLAWGIDIAAMTMLSAVLGYLVRFIGVISTDWMLGMSVLASFVSSIAYAIVFEWRWRGQTLGKRALRLRVVDAEGLQLQLAQVVVRNVLRALDMIPIAYLLGGIACLLSRKAQRLGDVAAGTIVIREAELGKVDLKTVIAAAKYNSLAAYPHLAARLRNRVPPEAAALALQAISSRDSYDATARLSLFEELAEYFRGLVRFPDEAVETLTAEQYVASVLRVLYRADP